MSDIEKEAEAWAERESQGDPGWYLTNQGWKAAFLAGAAAECEACAKLCEDEAEDTNDASFKTAYKDAAIQIRFRRKIVGDGECS